MFFEELIFRGVLLYWLIIRIGALKACLMSSVAFGIYHWFSYEVFGANLVVMACVFLVTGTAGWMFAFAFAKTQSLYAPIGLHFSWNLVSILVFSTGSFGNHLLVAQGIPLATSGWPTLLFFSLQAIIMPGTVTWYLRKRYKVTE